MLLASLAEVKFEAVAFGSESSQRSGKGNLELDKVDYVNRVVDTRITRLGRTRYAAPGRRKGGIRRQRPEAHRAKRPALTESLVGPPTGI